MTDSQKLPKNRTNYLFALSALVLTAMTCVAFSLGKNSDFELAKQEILLRKIGHELLLHSGDSTSRVLPIQKSGENLYQIRLENEFTFQPDSLVKIVRNSLAADQLATNYIVNVRNCSDMDIIFGYAISDNKKNDVIPCSGRKQPMGCYIIEIKFQDAGITPVQKGYLIGGIPLLAFIGLLVSRANIIGKRKKRDGELKIGNTIFDVKNRNLIFDDANISLTAKESKLLLILAGRPNQIIERSRLQKEIWEDEGVIVGRSLDMFISKLRKKLESDPSIQLMNIHGKGYRLDIE